MAHNVICDLTMVTYDIGPSLSPFVAEVLKVIKNEDTIKHMLTPMGSILEGDWDNILKLLDKLFKTFADDFERLNITLKIDYRRSKINRMEGKLQSVYEKLADSN